MIKKRQDNELVTEDNGKEKGFFSKVWENAVNWKKHKPEEEEETMEEEAVPVPDETEQAEAEEYPEEPDAAEAETGVEEDIDIEALGPNTDYLDLMRRELAGGAEPSEEGSYYSDYMMDGREPTEAQREFLLEIKDHARKLWLERLEAISLKDEEVTEEADSGMKVPGIRLYVRISDDKMEAWMFVFPPAKEEPDVTEEFIRSTLDSCKITFGIDEGLIRRTIKDRLYLKLIPIANGLEPVDGEDGRIVDHFSREQQFKLKERENKTINYRELNWLQHIDEGQVICDIIPPTECADGMRIDGEVYHAYRGTNAVPPMGKGTKLNEEKTALIAEVSGLLSFVQKKFKIESLLKIDSDVDFSVGNIDTKGDLTVQGDVLGGFTLKASGDIHISGVVRNATVISGGSIFVDMGVNGGGDGMLTAKDDIRSNYMENAVVKAGKSVYSSYIVNCEVTANNGVYVSGKRGCIIGGTIIAQNEIKANYIGNKQNRLTVIMLGSTPENLNEKYSLSAELKQVSNDVVEMGKNVAYLSEKTDATSEQKKQLRELNMELSKKKIEKIRIMKRLEQLGGEDETFTQCSMYANVIYPIAKITIGSITTNIEEERSKCRVTYKDGEIQIN